MSKTALKQKIKTRQDGKCSLTAEKLAQETSLFDTDRIDPKAKGGIYTDENTRVVNPVAHMQRHEIFRERTPELTELKSIIDGREQIRKLVNSLNNRLLAVNRKTDNLDKITQKWITEKIKETQLQLGRTDRRVDKFIKFLDLPIAKTALKIRGLGAVTIAYLLVYIDINKAQYASSLWSYCGYDKASHERYTKGESGGGNKTLRTVLFAMADSMIKTRAVYRDVYDAEKIKLENSMRITKSRNTQGKLTECLWSQTKPCHRHGAAMRKMIKHFLADFWLVWRTLEGLDTPYLYPEAKLGHTGIVKPEERGWVY